MSDKTQMNDSGESYGGVIPTKQPNKSGRPPEEAVEGRPPTKENAGQPNSYWTLSQENGTNGLNRVREAARKNGKLRFTALLHHVATDQLRNSYYSLKRKAAPGEDGRDSSTRKLVLTRVFDNWNFCQLSRIPSRCTCFHEVYLQGDSMHLSKRAAAEFLGTFWLVFGGCGSAVLAAAFPQLGIGFYGVALAFGLTVLTMAYAIGHVSGCHLNPAVSFGLVAGRRFPVSELLPYMIAQVTGGIAAAGVLYVVASGKAGFDLSSGFASNGYAEHSPGGYSLIACFVAEVVLTFFFLMIIMGATDKRAPAGFAPIAIGLGLTLIHLIGIPVTNLSVNPARSTGPAIFVGGWATAQLWLFWVAPIIGGSVGGALYTAMFEPAATVAEAPAVDKGRAAIASGKSNR